MNTLRIQVLLGFPNWFFHEHYIGFWSYFSNTQQATVFCFFLPRNVQICPTNDSSAYCNNWCIHFVSTFCRFSCMATLTILFLVSLDLWALGSRRVSFSIFPHSERIQPCFRKRLIFLFGIAFWLCCCAHLFWKLITGALLDSMLMTGLVEKGVRDKREMPVRVVAPPFLFELPPTRPAWNTTVWCLRCFQLTCEVRCIPPQNCPEHIAEGHHLLMGSFMGSQKCHPLGSDYVWCLGIDYNVAELLQMPLPGSRQYHAPIKLLLWPKKLFC